MLLKLVDLLYKDGYFDLFLPSVDSETVLFGNIGIGNRIWNGMHYNIVTPDQCWRRLEWILYIS